MSGGVTLWRSSWRVSQHRRRAFWMALVLFTIFVTLPAVGGYLLARAFDALTSGATATVVALAGLLALIEAARVLALQNGVLWFTRSWEYCRALLRYNMLDAQLASGGPDAGRPVTSTGAAIARFRDDSQDVAVFVDTWIDVTAGLVFSAVALGVLATVDPLATAVMTVPLVVVGVVTSLIGRQLRSAHRIDRVATAEVTGLLGDVMSAAITVKLDDAAEPVLARLQLAVDRRRTTAVRARLYEYTIRAFSRSTAEIGLGLVLLVSIGALADGTHRTRGDRAVPGVRGLARVSTPDARPAGGPGQPGHRGLLEHGRTRGRR